LDSLFDFDPAPSFDRDRLRDRLRELAARRVYIGGSSWKYEGWIGQIYSRSLYQTRGRFSKKLFEETCLTEYASVFPTVCGDFAFYQFPTDASWAKLFRQTPLGFRWALKVPEQITVQRWPIQPRYGALAGLENPLFLDMAVFERDFLAPLSPWRDRIGVLIFEFGDSGNRGFRTVADFAKRLDAFLDGLPPGWPCAVEVRNESFLAPPYFESLRAHNVTHVYNAWSRMPEIADQMRIPGSSTSDRIVARALLRRGRPYEQAVRMFAPYDRLQDINEPVRGALRELIEIAIVDGRPIFVFINNRLEGNSPATIMSILD
jgi:uncharacterized protein YecE (DUF72 family)